MNQLEKNLKFFIPRVLEAEKIMKEKKAHLDLLTKFRTYSYDFAHVTATRSGNGFKKGFSYTFAKTDKENVYLTVKPDGHIAYDLLTTESNHLFSEQFPDVKGYFRITSII